MLLIGYAAEARNGVLVLVANLLRVDGEGGVVRPVGRLLNRRKHVCINP
jgi:hypothetical protein